MNSYGECECERNWDVNQRHPYTMKALYVRVSHNYKRKLVKVGMICPVCKDIVLDDKLPALYGDYGKHKKELKKMEE